MTAAGPARPAQPERGGGPWRPAVDSGELLLVVVAGMLVVAAVAQAAASGVIQPRNALAFGALIALGELLRLSLPGDRESAPIGSAGALAYAVVLRVGDQAARQSAWQVIAVAAVGMTLGALPHLAAGRPAGLAGMASRLIAMAAVALLFRPLSGGLGGPHRLPLALGAICGLLVMGWFAECLLRALIRADALRARFVVTLWDEMRVQLPLGVAVAASAILVAFAAEIMGLAALALFIAPLLVTQMAFRRYAGIRATYLQTVRALARVTEVGGYVEDGHANRVGQLAVAVGRELGLSEPDLLELEYAALMHDIGQLSLRDPIPGGATVLASREQQRRIAELGAGVIKQAGVLDRVAEIVRCQDRPWREAREAWGAGATGAAWATGAAGGTGAAGAAGAGRATGAGRAEAAAGAAAAARAEGAAQDLRGPGEPSGADAAPPLGSRIIRAANAFDDLVGTSVDHSRSAAALERLRLDTAAEYDPRVVEALAKVAARRLPRRR